MEAGEVLRPAPPHYRVFGFMIVDCNGHTYPWMLPSPHTQCFCQMMCPDLGMGNVVFSCNALQEPTLEQCLFSSHRRCWDGPCEAWQVPACQ